MRDLYIRSPRAGLTGLIFALSVVTARAEELPRACTSQDLFIASTAVESLDLNPGLVRHADIGQSLTTGGKIGLMRSIDALKEPVTVSGSYAGAMYDVVLAPGELASTQNSGALAPSGYSFTYRREGRPRGWSRPELVLIASPDRRHIVARLDFGLTTQDLTVPAEMFGSAPCSSLDPKHLTRELVYSGVSHGTISLLYREYYDDIARPAFSQTLTYDLAEGPEVGYRGWRMKVLSANNTGLQYVVTSPLGD